MLEKFSRHYADTAALARHSAAMGAIDQHELRDRVVAWKRQFFGSAWATYDLAKPGMFRLVPPAGRLPALRARLPGNERHVPFRSQRFR